MIETDVLLTCLGRVRAESSGKDTWPEVGQEGAQVGWVCAERLVPRSFFVGTKLSRGLSWHRQSL